MGLQHLVMMDVVTIHSALWVVLWCLVLALPFPSIVLVPTRGLWCLVSQPVTNVCLYFFLDAFHCTR
jgi:hypothetical protein